MSSSDKKTVPLRFQMSLEGHFAQSLPDTVSSGGCHLCLHELGSCSQQLLSEGCQTARGLGGSESMGGEMLI